MPAFVWQPRSTAPAVALIVALAGCNASDGSAEDRPTAPEDAVWAAWPMPNSPGLGLVNEQSYEITSQGEQAAVLDRVTGLLWQRELGTGSFDFNGARTYCASLERKGAAAWRVPARIELVSLLELARSEPAIDGAAFPDTPGDWFWTASESADEPSLAWYTYFYFGYPDRDARSTTMRVRCVSARSGSTAAAASYASTEGAVRDELTKLTWQRAFSDAALGFVEATSYCAELALDGSEDWRVPSMLELETLVDEKAHDPAIDVRAFPDTPSEPFWTSSAWSGSDELGWYVSFAYGAALYDTKASRYFVRCVR